MIDFLCIGAHKSGTSWLNNNLKSHPDIWLPYYKELHFFDELEFGKSIREDQKRRRWLSRYLENLSLKVEKGYNVNINTIEWILDFIQTPYKKRDIVWYQNLFKPKKYKTAGEITPAYALLSINTYKEILAINKNIKIIFIMRNPAYRDWSSLRFDLLTKKNLTDKTEIKNLNRATSYRYLNQDGVIKRGNYLDTLQKLEAVFPKKNLKYLFFDDIENNPHGLMENVCNFLEISYSKEMFPGITKRKLVSKQTELDEEIEIFLKNRYQKMVYAIDSTYTKVPESWKIFFDL